MQLASTGAGSGQYLVFTVAGSDYAVAILRVREILAFDGLTRVPGAPAWVRGVVNVRGAVVPVADLAVRIGGAETRLTPRTCVVVVELDVGGSRTVAGLLADAVTQVIEIHAETVQPAPALGTGVRAEWLQGLARSEGGFVLLLDIDHALDADELPAA